jgi:hypothetical protein
MESNSVAPIARIGTTPPKRGALRQSQHSETLTVDEVLMIFLFHIVDQEEYYSFASG